MWPLLPVHQERPALQKGHILSVTRVTVLTSEHPRDPVDVLTSEHRRDITALCVKHVSCEQTQSETATFTLLLV